VLEPAVVGLDPGYLSARVYTQGMGV